MSDEVQDQAKTMNANMNQKIDAFLNRMRDQYNMQHAVLVFDFEINDRVFGHQTVRGDMARCFQLAYIAGHTICMNGTEVIQRG